MSAELKGDLLNTEADVFIDTALLVLIVCSYIPQIIRLRQDTAFRGISPYFVLFNVFFSTAQLSELLLYAAFAWPTSARPVLQQIGNGSLKGLEAFGGVLGLLQIFVQWSCSIIVLIPFAHAGGQNGRGISATAFLHAALVLFPVVALTLPQPQSDHAFATGIMMALINMSNFVVAPCFVVLEFYAQFREWKAQDGDPGALSLLSVAFQMVSLAALGFRWFLRLGRPTWDNGPAPVWLWYQWGFPAINYLLYAAGCAFLLACYRFAARATGAYGHSEEQVPLLR